MSDRKNGDWRKNVKKVVNENTIGPIVIGLFTLLLASWFKFTYFGRKKSRGKSRQKSRGKLRQLKRQSCGKKSYLGVESSTTTEEKVRNVISNSTFSQKVKDELNTLLDKVIANSIGFRDLYNAITVIFPESNIYNYMLQARKLVGI